MSGGLEAELAGRTRTKRSMAQHGAAKCGLPCENSCTAVTQVTLESASEMGKQQREFRRCCRSCRPTCSAPSVPLHLRRHPGTAAGVKKRAKQAAGAMETEGGGSGAGGGAADWETAPINGEAQADDFIGTGSGCARGLERRVRCCSEQADEALITLGRLSSAP